MNYFSALGVKYLLFHKNKFLNDEKIYTTDDFNIDGLSMIKETENLALYKLDRKAAISEKLHIDWDCISKPDKMDALILTFTPKEGTLWRNPWLSKKQTIKLKINNGISYL